MLIRKASWNFWKRINNIGNKIIINITFNSTKFILFSCAGVLYLSVMLWSVYAWNVNGIVHIFTKNMETNRNDRWNMTWFYFRLFLSIRKWFVSNECANDGKTNRWILLYVIVSNNLFIIIIIFLFWFILKNFNFTMCYWMDQLIGYD